MPIMFHSISSLSFVCQVNVYDWRIWENCKRVSNVEEIEIEGQIMFHENPMLLEENIFFELPR